MNEGKVTLHPQVLRNGNRPIIYANVKLPQGWQADGKMVQGVSNRLARQFPNKRFQLLTYHRVPIQHRAEFPEAYDGWKPGYDFYKPGEPVKYYRLPAYSPGHEPGIVQHMYDPQTMLSKDSGIVEFGFIIADPVDVGGANEQNNDCLFGILLDHFHGNPPGPKTAAKFKEALGLARGDMVGIDKMAQVERIYMQAISVVGDVAHTASKLPGRVLELRLVAGHYTYAKPQQAREPRLWMWKSVKEKSHVIIYDGEERELDRLTFFSKMFPIYFRNPRLAWKRAGPLTGPRGEPLAKQWADWQAERKALVPHGVDTFEMPFYNEWALREFALLTRADEWVKPDLKQQMWIRDCTMGGLVYGKRDYEGPAVQYDINSCYPYLMSKPSNTFPKGPGTWHTLKEKGKFWTYGIYRLKTNLVAPDRTKTQLYRTHRELFYTHYDLITYEEVTGKQPVLADDGQPNALLWGPKDRVHGSVAFGEPVKKWYALKSQNVPAAKAILTSLWGALMQKAKKTYVYREGSDVDGVLLSAVQKGDGRWEVETRPDDSIYLGQAPAVGCFLLAQARSWVAKLVGEQLKAGREVVRINTDCFAVTTDPELMTTTSIGGIKLEHAGYLKIAHANLLTWTGCKCKKCAAKPKPAPKLAAVPKQAPKPAPKPATTKLDAMAAFLAASE